MTTRNRELASIIDDSGNITTGGNLSVTGNLTQSSSTTTTYSDGLLELNNGAGSNSNDLGLVMERGSTGDNAIFLWDESNDGFAVGTTTATGSATGNISFSAAPFTASTITGTILNGSTSVRTPLIEYTDGDDALTIADGGAVTTSQNFSIGGSNNELRFYEGSNYVGFEAPALSADKIWVLPAADGSSGQLLKTDGSGNLSFTDDLTLANASVNNYSGDGSTTGFTLSTTPVSENATQVYINGVYQFKNTYAVSGTTLTFDTAPANGSSIEALVWSTVAINVPADASVTNAKLNASIITGQSEVTAADADHVLIYDASSSALKKTLVSDLLQTSEEIQDIVGAMFSSNTETGIAATYQDGDGTIDLVIGDDTIVSSMLDTNIAIAGTLGVTGNITGTLATAAQTNITSLGTLTALTVDDITINGSTISDGGDMTIDIGGDLTIDAAGNDVKFFDDGTQIGQIEMAASSGFHFRSNEQDADIRLKGNDGGSTITALLLDMSDAGAATFNAGATFGGAVSVGGNLDIAIASNTPYIRGGQVSTIFRNNANNASLITILNGGNVGIGTASPAQTLHTSGTGVQRIQIDATDNNAAGAGLYMKVLNSGSLVGNATMRVDNVGNINFFNGTSSESEKMRLDASGNLAVGVHNGTRAPQVLSVYMAETAGAVGSNTSAHFGGGNNSSGYLTGGFTLGFSESGTNQQYRKVGIFAQGQGSGSAVQNLLLCVRTNTDANQMSSGDAKISISGTNGVASGDFNDTSDIGFKENIQDIPDSLSLVKQLQPRTFTWKGPKEGRGNSTGFIAQEVETVIPLLISGNNVGSTIVADEGQGEDGVDTIGKSINTIGLVAHLTKAIQEQQTIIEDLKTRIETLEG